MAKLADTPDGSPVDFLKPAPCESRISAYDSDAGMDCRAAPQSILPGATAAGTTMRTYYFNVRDDAPARLRAGLEFATTSGAIEHSKELARRLRRDPRITDRSLSIVVIDESGAAVHRERVHPDTMPPKFQRAKR